MRGRFLMALIAAGLASTAGTAVAQNHIGSGDQGESPTLDPVKCPDLDADGYDACAPGDPGDDGLPPDCDDKNVFARPGNDEYCNGFDDNCDGKIDEGYDLDGDGQTWCDGDCDDSDPSTYTGAVEICDEVDNDCDWSIDEGFDQDGDGWTTCKGDCDDDNVLIRPGNAEYCNGFDDNCDGNVDEGYDRDGDGQTTCGGDCDDGEAAIYFGAAELCDGLDNDCNHLADDGGICAPPPEECGACEGGVTDLTLAWQGDRRADVRVLDHWGRTLYSGRVQPGEAFSFDGRHNHRMMGPKIHLLAGYAYHGSLHTSCSVEIGPGDMAGDFEVLEGASKDGGALCGPASDDGDDDGGNGIGSDGDDDDHGGLDEDDDDDDRDDDADEDRGDHRWDD
ncbi:MAG: hypothetical protein KC583_17985, partial [Myxococcales bacterium]|nr:hypothetical protein [Myxococcales bacterium]